MNFWIGTLCVIVVILAGVVVSAVSGEHIPMKTYQIETVDGQILNLHCPTLNLEKSAITYIYENQCVLVENKL